MSITGLGYLGMQSPNFKEWQRFGTEVLGLMTVSADDEEALYFRADERRHRLAIYPGEDDRIRYAGWEVAGEDEFAAMKARLDKAGVSWTEGSADERLERRVEGFIRFEDPAGMPHEVFYGAVVTYDPFVPGRPMAGFVTGAQGFGHIVFIVPDAKAAHAFFTTVLGFKLSDIVDTAFHTPGYFYRTNRRHHSIAVLEVPGMAGLHHLMLRDELARRRGHRLRHRPGAGAPALDEARSSLDRSDALLLRGLTRRLRNRVRLGRS